MNRRRIVTLVALLCSVAACSSEATVVSGTEPVAATSTSTFTTEPAVTSTEPAASTTMPPPATDAPTTTVASTGLDPRLQAEPLQVDPQCSEAGCTSVGVTVAGEVVTFDSATSMLTFTESGTSLAVGSSLGDLAALVLMGPDDVAYIAGVPPDASDPVQELIAVSTSGATAGQEIARVSGLDGSGDSTLIATAAGVMEVGCCGFGERLPVAGASLAMAWVTPTGEPSGVVVPEVHLEYPGDGTTVVVRTAIDAGEQRWTVPAMLAGRDMPAVAAAADGGALVWMYDPIGAPDTPAMLYDLRADGTVDVFAMGEFKYVAAMHPARFVVSHDGEMYVRIALP